MSFVGCGLQILTTLFSFGFLLFFEASDEEKANKIFDFFQYADPIQLIRDFIVELASLAGVILMWRLYKFGFYIYLIAECFYLFLFAGAVFSFGLDSKGLIQVALEMLWPIPFDLTFFIMYATQLKYMTKEIKWSSLR